MRRINQLGFSSLVFPGASHTRYAHSVGVYHNAKRLLQIIRKQLSESDFDEERASLALCAALLHDTGHGPFSHSFEGVQSKLGKSKGHETWTVDIVKGDTEVNECLADYSADCPEKIAAIIEASEPIDVYSTIISSQFDADRLDYLVRDRQMSGVAIGKFDLEWILDCLRIGDVYAGQRGEPDPIKVPGLVLDHKGFSAAEGYLEARYELYSTVYLHKTTRAAEQMLAALLRRTAEKLTENTLGKLGLSPRNPLFQFLKLDRPQLELYVRIDDAIVWSAIDDIAHCKDSELCELAQRIKSRRLFKCVDIGALVTEPGSDLVYRFRDALFEAAPTLGIERDWTLLEDQPRVVGYDWYSWGDENALKKVLVMNPEHNTNIDIGQKSDIIQTLSKKEFHRFYVPNEETREAVKQIWRDTVR